MKSIKRTSTKKATAKGLIAAPTVDESHGLRPKKSGSAITQSAIKRWTIRDGQPVDVEFVTGGYAGSLVAAPANVKPDITERLLGRRLSNATSIRSADKQAIIDRVKDWSGGEKQAIAWYEGAPIPSLGYKTAEQIVASGKASDVHAYIDHLADGGFA